MSVRAIIEFDDAAEHSFDTAILTLLNDKGQHLSQLSPNEILFSNFDGNVLPVLPEVSKRGGKTIVFSGANNTGQVANGVLEFPNEDQSLGTYQNITDIVDDFAFRVKVISNITGTIMVRDLVRLVSNVDNSEIRFSFANQGGGLTRVNRVIIDSGGTTVSNIEVGSQAIVDGTVWDIAFSNDDDGNTLTYINGVLQSTIASPAFNFTDCNFIFSDSSSANAAADYDNIQLFKTNELIANFAFPFPEETTFILEEQILVTDIPLLVDEIILVDIIHEIPANTQLKFFGLLDGQAYYHDGTNWAISNQTLAQSNTLAEIQANITAIPIVKGIGKILQLGSIFKSDLGYATPLIESVEVIYKITFKTDDVTVCNVFGTVFDNAIVPVVGATIRVQSADKFVNNVFIGPSAKAITNNQGKFSISLPETETDGTAVDIFVEYTEKQIIKGIEVDQKIIFEYKNRVIPNLVTRELSQLVTL